MRSYSNPGSIGRPEHRPGARGGRTNEKGPENPALSQSFTRCKNSIFELTFIKVAIVLDTSDTQALHPRTVDCALPGSEFLQRQAITV